MKKQNITKFIEGKNNVKAYRKKLRHKWGTCCKKQTYPKEYKKPKYVPQIQNEDIEELNNNLKHYTVKNEDTEELNNNLKHYAMKNAKLVYSEKGKFENYEEYFQSQYSKSKEEIEPIEDEIIFANPVRFPNLDEYDIIPQMQHYEGLPSSAFSWLAEECGDTEDYENILMEKPY